MLAVLPNRRINCLIPGRRDHGRTLPGFVITVDADVDDNVVELKKIIGKDGVGLFEEDSRPYYFHLFPAIRGGSWLQASSSEAGDVEYGDLSVLDEIVKQNPEMTASEKASEVFSVQPGGKFHPRDCHAAHKTHHLRSPGYARKQVQMDENAYVSALKDACRQKDYL